MVSRLSHSQKLYQGLGPFTDCANESDVGGLIQSLICASMFVNVSMLFNFSNN